MRRQPYSQPADLWALGVVTYELLTLHRPFAATNFTQLAENICSSTSNVEHLEAAPHPAALKALTSKATLFHPEAPRRMTLSRYLGVLRKLLLAEPVPAAGAKTQPSAESQLRALRLTETSECTPQATPPQGTPRPSTGSSAHDSGSGSVAAAAAEAPAAGGLAAVGEVPDAAAGGADRAGEAPNGRGLRRAKRTWP